MKLIFTILYVGQLVALFNRAIGQPIKTSGVTTLHITTENPAGSLPLTAQVYHVFPAFDFSELQDSLSSSKTQTWLRCPVRVTQTGYLSIGQDQLDLWLVPGDTVHVHLTPSGSSLTERYRFTGHTQAEQNYYLAKRARFTIAPNQTAMNAGVQSKDLAGFRHKLDSLTSSERFFLQQYQQTHSVPAPFVRFESDAIRYNDAMLRLYMSWYKPDYQKKKQSIPPDYFDFLQRIPARNPAAQYDYAYLNFLREYVNHQAKNAGISVTNKSQDKAAVDKLINQRLGTDLGGFFRLWAISYGVQDNPERARTELAMNTFPAHYQYLLIYLNQRSAKKAAVLSPGDKAPGFFLPDTHDSLVSLSQFKGQAVYLCFWFATCGGCYHEFPYENQLVKQFEGQPVKIVSICTITKPDKWRETIRKVGLKTVNLLADPAWQKTLEEKYAISVYPHYVLIDADGRIVENFTTRPSHNAAAKIKQVVARIELR